MLAKRLNNKNAPRRLSPEISGAKEKIIAKNTCANFCFLLSIFLKHSAYRIIRMAAIARYSKLTVLVNLPDDFLDLLVGFQVFNLTGSGRIVAAAAIGQAEIADMRL